MLSFLKVAPLMVVFVEGWEGMKLSLTFFGAFFCMREYIAVFANLPLVLTRKRRE